MKICFLCDLHLPFDTRALQYRVLDWAVGDIAKKAPDCIAFAGDVTCDGEEEAYRYFLQHIDALEIPFLYIPGNSDLRCAATAETLKDMASRKVMEIGGKRIFAVNDCDRTVSEQMLCALDGARRGDIVFMHHPLTSLRGDSAEKMSAWRAAHPDTMLFYGHKHLSARSGNDVCLQSMDPDKSIGESACITYYDTDTDTLTPSYFFCPVPVDMHGYLGISCYRPEGDIELATKRGLKYLELRKNVLDLDPEVLAALLAEWRATGGVGLSLHLPEIGFEGGKVLPDARLDEYLALIPRLGIDRVTQHVPKIPVGMADALTLDHIAKTLAEKLNTVCVPLVIGVENMHMTKNERADEYRRFGYTPEECFDFMTALGRHSRHTVGINFDIGHARNNAPFSRRYPISTWLSMLGEYIVGYHVHQVRPDEGGWKNHMPIDRIYGKLISYGSFFRCWAEGQVAKAPVIFEMRPEGAYETTLAVFEREKNKQIFDLHAHGR
ncbi:MAG: metallophosphoesterase family protein, partial [Clostridia bacterium]|nr:metallophosphoesterase family protein [Clostridia bacterium]